MNPSAPLTLNDVKQLLLEWGFRPLKQLGQNFLVEPDMCKAIVDLLDVKEGDTVIEVGPGLGALTAELLNRGVQLTALELDKGLIEFLTERFKGVENFTLVHGDALDKLPDFKADFLVGNLPYNISTPMTAQLLKQEFLFKRCVFTVQKEVGLRYAAKPNTSDYGAITILLQSLYEASLHRELPPEVFHPRPNVDSAVVKLQLRESFFPTEPKERVHFYNLLRRAFSQRRKKLKNVVKGLDLDLRAQQLSIEDWQKLYDETGRHL